MAGGVMIALLDHDDLLREHALYMVAALLIEHPDTDLIFSDEDKIDPKGRRYSPYFKSDWNLDLLLGQNMFSHLGVYRRSLVEEIGGFRSEYDGSQDYDLVLRAQSVIARDRIRHIPHVLYHWRAIPGSVASVSEDAKPYALIRARLAIADYLAKSGSIAEVLPSAHAAFSRVRFALPDPPPSITIVVSNLDSSDLGLRCVDSLLQRTDYADFEILIIDDNEGVNGQARFSDLRSDPRIRVLSYGGPKTFSATSNFAVAQAAGQLICFLSGNAEISHGDWLSEMASHASRPGIGAVGALLINPDGRIKHAGIVLNSDRVAQSAYERLKAGGFGYFGRATLTQNLSAVSADCIVMRKAVFDETRRL